MCDLILKYSYPDMTEGHIKIFFIFDSKIMISQL